MYLLGCLRYREKHGKVAVGVCCCNWRAGVSQLNRTTGTIFLLYIYIYISITGDAIPQTVYAFPN